jgi:putative oxidoreductase
MWKHLPWERYKDYLTIPLRLALGMVFLYHGSQKLFGGLSGFAEHLPPLFQPPFLWACLAAASEFFGGLLVLLGLLTRGGALLIVPVMLVAIFFVHWGGGFSLQNKGFEYPFVLLCMALALILYGGGPLSVDTWFARRRGRDEG